MTKKLLLAVLASSALQFSCGGTELPVLENLGPDFLSTSSWPDAPDLGVVVSSGVVPSADIPPPPDFTR